MGIFGFGKSKTLKKRIEEKINNAINLINLKIGNEQQGQLGEMSSLMIDPLWIGNGKLGIDEVRLRLMTHAIMMTDVWIVLKYVLGDFRQPQEECVGICKAICIMEFAGSLNNPNSQEWAMTIIDNFDITGIENIVNIAYSTKDIESVRGIVNDARFAGGICGICDREKAEASLLDPEGFRDEFQGKV